MSVPRRRNRLTVAVPGPSRAGLLDLVGFLRDPRGSLQAMVRAYGDPFAVPDRHRPTVFTGDPDAIRTVFAADPDRFDIPLRESLAPFFGGSSLILTGGERHRKDRKLLTPPFHGARMRAYGRAIVASARTTIGTWSPGRPFRMLDATQAITLDVILRAVFGVDEDERRDRFRAAVVELVGAMASPVITLFEFTRLELGGVGPWARYLRAKAGFDALVAEEIAVRRGRADDREDVLSLLMQARYDDGAAMTDAELRDQLHLLLFAGHDTTSTALAWAFYWLERHPEVRQRVLAELAPLGDDPEPDAIAALPYLEAVCRETLRIHPVVMNIGRLLREPLDLVGFRVPAGATLMVSTLLLHDREELYPEPRTFRPERFVERKYSPFEFVPFGGGARRCIGAALASYEMKLVIATVSRACRPRLVRDEPVKSVIRGLTMGPKGGIPMVIDR